MTQIDLSKLIFHSSFSGLGNDSTISGSGSIPSHAYETSPDYFITTVSTPLTVGTDISQIEVNIGESGVNPINDPRWYVFKGFMGNFYTVNIPNSDYEWTNDVTSKYFEIDIYSSYTATDLVFTIFVYFDSINAAPFPGAVLNYRCSTYTTPF